jgi:hypothetical protein
LLFPNVIDLVSLCYHHFNPIKLNMLDANKK